MMVFTQTNPSDSTSTCLTLEEYHAMEEKSPDRHEYNNNELNNFKQKLDQK